MFIFSREKMTEYIVFYICHGFIIIFFYLEMFCFF